jgi:hypothetical protein
MGGGVAPGASFVSRACKIAEFDPSRIFVDIVNETEVRAEPSERTLQDGGPSFPRLCAVSLAETPIAECE